MQVVTILTRLSLRLRELLGLRFEEAKELRRLDVVGLLRPFNGIVMPPPPAPLLMLLPFIIDVERLVRGNVLLPSLTFILTLNMILF